MEQPNISTNPLSMLAPGIFRRIFEGHIPNRQDAPTNAPVSPHGEIRTAAASAKIRSRCAVAPAVRAITTNMSWPASQPAIYVKTLRG